MTTTVNVIAHPFDGKEVHVLVDGFVVQVLQHGESATFYAYDERTVTVREVEKLLIDKV